MDDKYKKIADKVSASDENAVLAKLWRNILKDSNRNSREKLELLVDAYLRKNNHSKIKGVKLKTKSTVVDNVTADGMSFKTFIFNVFSILTPLKATLTIKLDWPGGGTTVSSIVIKNNKTEGATDEGNDSDNPNSDVGKSRK